MAEKPFASGCNIAARQTLRSQPLIVNRRDMIFSNIQHNTQISSDEWSASVSQVHCMSAVKGVTNGSRLVTLLVCMCLCPCLYCHEVLADFPSTHILIA